MNWLEEYENMTEKDKQTFIEGTNTLLGQTYLVGSKQDDRKLYRFCERYFDLLQQYFLLSGWNLHHVKIKGVIYINHNMEGKRYRFSLEETIFLAILRHLYDEKVKELNLTQRVMVTNRDIWERYLALNIKERLPAQDSYQRTLKLFQSFSMLELKHGSWSSAEAVFVLYPSLEEVLSSSSLNAMIDWIEKSSKGEENDETYHTITDD